VDGPLVVRGEVPDRDAELALRAERGSPNIDVMSSGGRKTGSCSPSSAIQSCSTKKCCRPVRVCQGLDRSTLMTKGCSAAAVLAAAPLRRGDDRRRSGLGVGEGDLLALVLRARSASRVRCASPSSRSPARPGGRWSCRTSRGSPRTSRRRAGSAAGRPGRRGRAVLVAEVLDRLAQVEREALGRRRRGCRAAGPSARHLS
jgi:hypothetical protein